MSLQMYRGRLQALFSYLPEQTFNWENRRLSFKGTADVDTRPANVPTVWLKRPLRRLLMPFVRRAAADGTTFPGLEVIESGSFEVLEPRKLRGEIFPETWICRTCDKFRVGRRVNCGAHGEMRQLGFVEYHRCGYVAGLEAPRCTNRCRGPFMLRGTSSRQFADWKWVCSTCNRPADRGVFRQCPHCRSGTVRVLRPDASPVYYAQYLKVVNPPTVGDMTVLDSPAVYPAAIAQGLGRLPPNIEGLRRAVNDTSTPSATGEARRKLMDDFGIDAEEADELLAKRASRAAAGNDWEGAVNALGLDDEARADIGEECIELSLSLAASPLTFADLEKEAPSADLAELYRRDYPALISRLGVADAVLLREFPLAYIMAGYTRERRAPDETGVVFNFFQPVNGVYPMYGQRVVTEGVLFRLQPQRVVDWLVASGVIGDPDPGTNPTAWLYERLRPVESVFEPPKDRITAAVLGLVHSMSHRVVGALGDRAGLRRESLSEHLLPFNLSFIVYADTRSDFVMGGLEHVYRNYLSECLWGLPDAVRCVFDPPCNRGAGACAVCMYLSENSCERFNSALSRHFLFGGTHDGVTWTRYWTP